VLVDDIGDGLGVGCGTGSTAVYSIVDMRELVGDSVGLLGERGLSDRRGRRISTSIWKYREFEGRETRSAWLIS
jgi:hypothetical protein